ncbi:MAG: hypothetical protein AAFN93_25680 [Bacteroidota bacterium]
MSEENSENDLIKPGSTVGFKVNKREAEILNNLIKKGKSKSEALRFCITKFYEYEC